MQCKIFFILFLEPRHTCTVKQHNPHKHTKTQHPQPIIPMRTQSRTLTLALAATLVITAFAAPNASAQSFWNIFGIGNSSSSSSHNSIRPAFPDIGRNLTFLDRYSDEMLSRYSNEFVAHRTCPKHRAFLNTMKVYNRRVDTLVLASRGKCTKTFKKAACDTRESLTTVEKARKGLQISDRVCFLIRQSGPYATFIHKYSSRWQPVISVSRPTCGTPVPVATRPTPAPARNSYGLHSGFNGGRSTTYQQNSSNRRGGGGYY